MTNGRKEARAWMDEHVIVLGSNRGRAERIKDILAEQLTPQATENERKEMRTWMDQHVVVLGSGQARTERIKDILAEKLTPQAVEKADEEAKRRELERANEPTGDAR